MFTISIVLDIHPSSEGHNCSVCISNAFNSFFPLFLFSETQRCTSGFKSMELFRVCLLIHQMNCLLGAVFPQKKDMKGRLCAHLVGYVKIFCNT